MLARRAISWRSTSETSAPAPESDDHDPPEHRDGAQVVGEMRSAHELEDHVGTRPPVAAQHRVGEARVVDRLAAQLAHERRGIARCARCRARGRPREPDLQGGAADAARGAVHEQGLAPGSAPPGCGSHRAR